MDAIVPYYPLTSSEVQIYLTLVHEGMDVMQIFAAQLEAIKIAHCIERAALAR